MKLAVPAGQNRHAALLDWPTVGLYLSETQAHIQLIQHVHQHIYSTQRSGGDTYVPAGHGVKVCSTLAAPSDAQ